MVQVSRIVLELVAFAVVFGTSTASNSDRPNIVLVVADDLGWNDVSFHGSYQIPTPNLDALAYDGILLKNYYVQPICTPTRGALLTARYPIHTGLQHSVIVSSAPYGLGLDQKLLSNYLKDLNYSTHIVGKWHLGFHAKEFTPIYRGFDSHYGYYQGCGDYYDHTYTNSAGGDPKQWGLDFRRNMSVEKTAFGQYSTELFSNEAERIVQNHNTDKPLFLYLPHQAVHSGNPMTGNELEAPWKYLEKMKHIKHPKRRIFAAMVSALDDAVGNVTRALHSRGMLNNTVIVFTSDNGGPAAGFDFNFANNWPLRGLKSTLWEGGTRVAGFIWSPLLKNSGYHANQMVHVVDWMPTLLHAAGYDMHKLPRDLDGIDQWDILSNNDDSQRTEFLYNIDPNEPSSAVRLKDMKLIYGLGSTSTYSGWYKPEMMNKQVNESELIKESDDLQDFKERYNSKIVDTESALQSWNESLPMSVDERPAIDLFQTDLLRIFEELGRQPLNVEPYEIDCSYRPANYSTNCNTKVKPCLFNITADPCEFNNLADHFPDIVAAMQNRLVLYSNTMVPPRNKKIDPKGFPYYHYGIWEPWINLADAEFRQSTHHKQDFFNNHL